MYRKPAAPIGNRKNTACTLILVLLLACSTGSGIGVLQGCACQRSPHHPMLDGSHYLSDPGGNSLPHDPELRARAQAILADAGHQSVPALDIIVPFDGAVFPKDMASPEISWNDGSPTSTQWLVVLSAAGKDGMAFCVTDRTRWTPPQQVWEWLKKRSASAPIIVSIYGTSPGADQLVHSQASIQITISPDEVGAPLFFQHMPLPFRFAKNNPQLSSWFIGDISSYDQPRQVMSGLPMCGNCHAFSPDGSTMGMDMDLDGDKGAYFLSSIRTGLEVTRDKFISWNHDRTDIDSDSMGLFSRISPDNSTVISTVQETSFFATIPDIDYSQFFFPIKGKLACYDRRRERFALLPGADLSDWVQTSPAWHPDGKTIVFARTPVNEKLLAMVDDKGAFTREPDERIDDLNRKYRIHYDLYTIPFNRGKGGTATPLPGASNNGKSNYFPRYSPDGRWIVFTQSDTGLAIQPSSKLVIIPAAGGRPRVLSSNMEAMNSWHSWSPNGKWVVFSSKALSPYTQLFLTHIDEVGNGSVPVRLSRFNGITHACLVPEFVNIESGQFPDMRIVDLSAK